MALDQTVFGWNFTSEKIRALLVFFFMLTSSDTCPKHDFSDLFFGSGQNRQRFLTKFALEDNEMKEGVFGQHKDSWVKVHHTLGIQDYIPHSPMKRNTKWKFQT